MTFKQNHAYNGPTAWTKQGNVS